MAFSRLFFWCGLLAALGCATIAGAQTSESKAERDLKELVERQRTLLTRAAQAEVPEQVEDLRPQLQQLVFDYERYLRDFPNVAAGYVSYALLLGNPLLDERKRAAALLLKANSLNSDLPIVKNQLGKYLAEDGRPLEALNYFLAAVQLEPKEPLYHFQIGQLLSAARDDFLKSGEWTPEQIETAMREAFQRATQLAPGNIAYAYRWAETYYDLEHPEWSEALAVWRALEARVSTPVERQTMRLHQANVLVAQRQYVAARAVLDTVTEGVLLSQKMKLEERLAAETAAPAVPAGER
jgi:tetratricopeptide (TPR) repeat protein